MVDYATHCWGLVHNKQSRTLALAKQREGEGVFRGQLPHHMGRGQGSNGGPDKGSSRQGGGPCADKGLGGHNGKQVNKEGTGNPGQGWSDGGPTNGQRRREGVRG